MKKRLVEMEKTGSKSTLILLWIFFFWLPIIPICYWLFKMKKRKTYRYDRK